MEVTLETVKKNKEKYNENIRKLKEEKAELMKQLSKLDEKRKTLTDEIDIAELEVKKIKLVQEINDIVSTFKGNRLTLEQFDLQQDVLESKIDSETYAKGMVANRKAKEALWKEQELMYCKAEVKKCEKKLELYTLMGDTENIIKQKEALSKAQKELEDAQAEVSKERTGEEKNSTFSSREDETTGNIPESQIGYSREENETNCLEKWEQVVKDDSGNEIGTRTIIETLEYETGKRIIDTVTNFENKDGKYRIKEFSEGIDKYTTKKLITGFNKLTRNDEMVGYTKYENGYEVAFSRINGKTILRVSKDHRSTVIELYDKNGKIEDYFEYNSEGKAIKAFKGMDEIPEDYVEKFIERTARNIPECVYQSKELEGNSKENILESAIGATEESTRTSTINQEANNIRNMQEWKMQETGKESNNVYREEQ